MSHKKKHNNKIERERGRERVRESYKEIEAATTTKKRKTPILNSTTLLSDDC